MPKVARFEELDAWKTAHSLALAIYRVTRHGDFSRDRSFQDQLRRAAVSVPSNIAEGFERGSDKSFLSFLAIAKGSAGEVRSQLQLAHDLGYLSEAQFLECRDLCLQTSYLLNGLIQYLKRSIS